MSPPGADIARGTAPGHLRGNRDLIENPQAATWAPSTGLEAMNTTGWHDGRTTMVLTALARLSANENDANLLADVRQWANVTAA